MGQHAQERTAARGAAAHALETHRAPTSVNPQEVHKWLQDFNWEFEQNRTKYATKYHMSNVTKEQFKLTAKEYARMEVVKEERQFGTLLDGMSRIGAGNRMHPRWGEAMKVFSNYLECGEYNAIAGSALLWDSAQSAEQKNGYLAQVIDEIRHSNQTAYLNMYYGKHYHDPAGHTDARRVRTIGPAFKGVKRAFGEGFMAGDPVECSINLQLVAEACFTNPLIVALTEWAALNGDEITPTVFLSIETDELRHMANGYQTIVSIVNDPAAQKYLQTDIDNAFWTQSKYFTPVLGYLFEYCSKFKVEPWAKTWNRWVYEDWAGIWLGRLSKHGVKTPGCLADAKQDAVWSHHDIALLAYATWPLHHWKHELPDKEDMEWFEKHYPGWYDHYGKIYDAWRAAGYEDPKSGFCPIRWAEENGVDIYIDRVSQLPFAPAIAKGATKLSVLEVNGKRHAFSDPWSERQYLQEPERYEAPDMMEQYEGWDIADVIVAGGGVRSDGKTLVAQPHLKGENMWTIDDIRRMGYTFSDSKKRIKI